MVKKITIILIFCFIIVFLTGCWNNRPLNQMTFATAIGFDKAEDGKIETTIQLAKPSVVGAKEKQGGEEPVWIYSYSAETVLEALRGMLTTVNRKIFVGHINLIVIDDKLAEEGIAGILDLFASDHETNRKADVLIAKEIQAKEVLQAESELEDIPAKHISGILENNNAYARIKRVKLFDLLDCFSAVGFSPTIGVIQPKNKSSKEKEIKDLQVQGTAIFNKDELVGWLEPTETRGLLFVDGKVKSGIINITNPKETDKELAFELVDSKTEKKAKFKNGELKFLIEVTATGRLDEKQGKENVITRKMIEKLEPKIDKIIKRDINKIVNLAQNKYHTDILGFSKIVHRKYLDHWKEVKGNWDQIFSKVPVEIKVTSKIRSSGMVKQQFGVR